MGIIWDGERRAAEKLAGLFSSCHFQAKVVCCGVKMTQKWSLNGDGTQRKDWLWTADLNVLSFHHEARCLQSPARTPTYRPSPCFEGDKNKVTSVKAVW